MREDVRKAFPDAKYISAGLGRISVFSVSGIQRKDRKYAEHTCL